ncbi:MAG: AraC family transcriptional regulator [Planctomycetota bacterium]|nr:AraC family transcriptional regulator [Planctomycetota bacterium]
MRDETLLDPYDLQPVVRRWEHHPGFARGVVGPRALPDHEFVLITQGAGRYEDDRGARRLLAGDLYLLRPHERHTFYWGSRGTWHCFIHFDFDARQRQPRGPIRLAGARPFPNPLHLGLGSPAAKQMLEVARRVKPGQPWSRLRWRGEFLAFLAHLFDGPLRPVGPLDESGADRAAQGVSAWRARQALETLQRRLGDPQLAIGDLAEAAGLSESHFRRLCREVFGRGPLELIQRRRLNLARELLLDPRLQVGEIARACGFADVRYFTRLFGRAEGLSPRQYRNAMLSGRKP